MKFLEITLNDKTTMYLSIDSIQGVEIKPDNSTAIIFVKLGDRIVLNVSQNIIVLRDKLSRISF